MASKNEVKTYPICETIQKNHICDEVISPAELEKSIAKLINNYAQKATKAIKGIGIFAYEFFIDKNNNVYLNESAPRPHNSAHYTIEGCQTSQFENHIRAVTNDKLGKTTLKVRYAVMKNILGTQNGASQFVLKLPNKDNIFIHLYGKKQSRVGRKMGHLTITGDNLEELQKMAREYQGAITI